MNALVEDQMRRLRQVLDGPATHEWLDATRGGNRVTFGRYTGQTPVTGDPGDARARQRLKTKLVAIEQEALSAKNAGIEGVPCFIFGGKFAVSGAQAPEYLAQAIARIASGEADAAE